MNKIRIFTLLLLIVTITTGCGNLNPKKVDKSYVENEFSNHLSKRLGKYGLKYDFEIVSFNEKSDAREASGIVRLKDKLNTVCEINGSIQKDGIEAFGSFGTSYSTSDNCKEIILSNIEKKLEEKYSFEINDETNYEILANNIKSYIKEFNSYLDEYDKDYLESFYPIYHISDKYLYGYINIKINGNIKKKEIFIDNDNGLVSESQYQDGYIELSEYLKSLAN